MGIFTKSRRSSFRMKWPKLKLGRTKIFKGKKGRKTSVLGQTVKLATGLALVETGMSLRKRIKMGPLTLNLSKQGISTTIGTNNRTPFLPQASVNIGKRGTYLNTSLVGTGAYKRTRLDQKESSFVTEQEQNIEHKREVRQNTNRKQEQGQNFFQKHTSSNTNQQKEDIIYVPSTVTNVQHIDGFDSNKTPWYEVIPPHKAFFSPAGLTIVRIGDREGGKGKEFELFCPHCESIDIKRPSEGLKLFLIFVALICFISVVGIGIGILAVIGIYLDEHYSTYHCNKCLRDIRKNDMMVIYETTM